MFLAYATIVMWLIGSPIDALFNAVFLRTAVTLYNKMFGGPEPEVQEVDHGLSYTRPRTVNVPEPTFGESYLMCLFASWLLYVLWFGVVFAIRATFTVEAEPGVRWDLFALFQGIYLALLIMFIGNLLHGSTFQVVMVTLLQRGISFAIYGALISLFYYLNGF